MIQTKVARILSPKQVVLASGTNDGVSEGMQFIIFQLSDEILDPETKESLGRLEIVKGRVAVTHVQERISIATTPSRTIKKTESALTASYAALLGQREVSEVVYDQLRVEESNAIQADLTVRVGDLARMVGP